MSHFAQMVSMSELLEIESIFRATCQGFIIFGMVFDKGTTVHNLRECVSVFDITTIGLRFTISGGTKPVSKLQIRT